jgi:hypothetical protein
MVEDKKAKQQSVSAKELLNNVPKQAEAARRKTDRAAAVASIPIASSVRHGPFQSTLADVTDNSVDLIFTADRGVLDFPGLPVGVSSIPEPWWRERYYERCKIGASTDTRKRAYRRAVDGLLAADRVAADRERVWLTGTNGTNGTMSRPS